MFNRLTDDAKEMIHEQVAFRELLMQMTRRDLMLRYKQTVMGFGWAVFMPLLNTLIFSVMFTRVAKLDVGMPYPLFAYCGLLTWNLFASSLRFALTSLTANTSLVTKVYFPREIFPFSAVFVSVVDLAVGATLLVGMMVVLPRGGHISAVVPADRAGGAHRVYRGNGVAAGDVEFVLPRRQVSLRGRVDAVDVRLAGRVSGAHGRRDAGHVSSS